MCTTIILNRPAHDWPILLAANRDERLDRPWKRPAAHWPDRPGVVGGLDELAGGSWLAINGTGVVAAVLNRHGTLGPAAGKRSRGELVLDALDYADAVDAADALSALDPAAWRPFNLVIADNRDAFLLTLREAAKSVDVAPLPEGLAMITAGDLDDPTSPRIALHRPRFLAAPPPDPDRGDWSAWEALLASRDRAPDSGPAGALFIDPEPPDDPHAFGTASSSLIALPAIGAEDRAPVFRFASGPPESWNWETVRHGDQMR
jgi:uncharacterized protein with NRDE domain